MNASSKTEPTFANVENALVSGVQAEICAGCRRRRKLVPLRTAGKRRPKCRIADTKSSKLFLFAKQSDLPIGCIVPQRQILPAFQKPAGNIGFADLVAEHFTGQAWEIADEITTKFKQLQKLLPQKLGRLHDEVFLQQAIKLHVQMKDPGCNCSTVSSYPSELALLLRSEIPKIAQSLGITLAQLACMYKNEIQKQEHALVQELLRKCVKPAAKTGKRIPEEIEASASCP